MHISGGSVVGSGGGDLGEGAKCNSPTMFPQPNYTQGMIWLQKSQPNYTQGTIWLRKSMIPWVRFGIRFSYSQLKNPEKCLAEGMTATPSPDAVTFLSFCMSKRKNRDPIGGSKEGEGHIRESLLRDLAALTNSIYCNSQHGALMNRFPVMVTAVGWREFLTIFWFECSQPVYLKSWIHHCIWCKSIAWTTKSYLSPKQMTIPCWMVCLQRWEQKWPSMCISTLWAK